MGRLAVIVVASVLCTGGPAAAQPGIVPPAPVIDVDEVEVDHYAVQIVLGDLATLGAGLLASKHKPEHGMLVGGLGYGLLPAAIHLAHGNPGRALLSTTLRAGFVVTGVAIGLSTKDCECEDDSNIGHAIFGGIAGGLAAIAIDVFLLARTERTRLRTPGPAIAPTFSAGDDQVMFGIGGAL